MVSALETMSKYGLRWDAGGYVDENGDLYATNDATNAEEVYRNDQGAWNATKARRILATIPHEVIEHPITQEIFDYFMLKGGVEEAHIKRIKPARLQEPITGLIETVDGETGVLIIDGTHRIVKRWKMGLRTVMVRLLPEKYESQISVLYKLIPPADIPK